MPNTRENSKLDSLSTKVETLTNFMSKEIARLEAVIASKDTKIVELENEVKSIRSTVNSSSSTITSLRSAVNEVLPTKIEMLEASRVSFIKYKDDTDAALIKLQRRSAEYV